MPTRRYPARQRTDHQQSTTTSGCSVSRRAKEAHGKGMWRLLANCPLRLSQHHRPPAEPSSATLRTCSILMASLCSGILSGSSLLSWYRCGQPCTQAYRPRMLATFPGFTCCITASITQHARVASSIRLTHSCSEKHPELFCTCIIWLYVASETMLKQDFYQIRLAYLDSAALKGHYKKNAKVSADAAGANCRSICVLASMTSVAVRLAM